MAKPSLLQQFTFKEVQLVVREAPSIPAKLKPFVGVHFNSSLQVFRILSDLKSMDVETFLCLHLDGKNIVKALQVVSIGSLSHHQWCCGHSCSQPPERRSCTER